MPAQDRIRSDQKMGSERSGQPPHERSEHGPVRPVQAWPWVDAGRRTATSWRSTRDSTSLAEDERHDSKTSPSTCLKIK